VVADSGVAEDSVLLGCELILLHRYRANKNIAVSLCSAVIPNIHFWLIS
jgi:hypothetical protein